MLLNYLKIAWRKLIRNKAFSAINIVGLAIGMATCLLISLFVLDELSYDRYPEKADRIVRVTFKGMMNGEKMREASVMPPVAQTLRADYPEVLEATRLRTGGMVRVTYQANAFQEQNLAYVDSNFLAVFSLPVLKGADTKSALMQPNTVVITTIAAQKLFGNDDPIGKLLTFKNAPTPYTVTGVIDPIPANSHFHFDLFASMSSLSESRSTSWLQSNFFTYLVLPEGYDYRKLQAKLPQVADKYMAPQLKQMMGVSLAEFRRKGNDIGLVLQPLTDIHLHSDLKPESSLEPGGDIRYVYVFGSIALFMLLLAGINFMNLSTASATKRAKEVGVRKVMGSAKSALVSQFLAESILLTGLALVLAVGLVWLLLPFLNDLSGKTLRLNFIQMPWLLPSLLGFGLVVGMLAGSYPAFFLSSFKPIVVLKGGSASVIPSRSGFNLRSGLVVFQFFISFLLLVGTSVVYRQLRYIQSARLGYDKEQVLVIERTWALGKNESVFCRQLGQDSRVVTASVSGHLPTGPTNNGLFSLFPDGQNEQVRRVIRYGIDHNYLPAMGIKLVAGRNFLPTFSTDSTGVLINETAARTFGFGNNAIGRMLSSPNNQGEKRSYRVIGVVQDFHFRSLHEQIAPLAMVLGDNAGSVIVKAKTQDMAGLLASVKKQWTSFKSEEPFRYSFLDESYQATYEAELKTGQILGLFAGLTIFVACLGLFGLATFTAEQRTKEIGVRKVLGASVGSIVTLLSKDFLKLVLIAIVIASPIAWYAMNQWLQDFAYKIDIKWWVFALAGLLVVGIALLTVSFQSVKAALMNPVKSLRSE